MFVYERVRCYLEEHGINSSQAAQKCGIPAATFTAIISGRQKMYAEDLRALCYALEIPPEEFMEYNAESA